MQNSQLQTELARLLLEEKDPSFFLQRAFELRKKEQPGTSYALLARRMGFASRSFVRLLIEGKRRPNPRNFKKIADGLGLSSTAAAYFGLLVEQQNQKIMRPSFAQELNAAELKVRSSLRRRSLGKYSKNDPVPFAEWPFVYAALGEKEKGGRTLEQISERSGRSEQQCEQILRFLESKGMVKSSGDCFQATEDFIHVGELTKSQVMKRFYSDNAVELARRVHTNLSSPDSLFYSSVFSVEKRRLPELARELRKLLVSFSSEFEEGKGEELAVLTTGLIPVHRA